MPFSSRILPRTLTALGVAAGVSLPSVAHALDGISISPGVSLSLSFGQKVSFGLGVDLRATALFGTTSCTEGLNGVGIFAQATWLNFSAGRFAAGLHGGRTLVPQIYALDGELGWTYHTRYDEAHPGEHGIHVGILNNFPLVFTDVSARLAIPVASESIDPEATFGVGARIPGVFQNLPLFGCAVVGRPLRAGDGIMLPPARVLGPAPRRSARLDGATRGELASAWLDDARAECGSIPAFLALARDLRAVGAPASLVERALGAARDEVRHTALCSGLASAFAGWNLEPALISPPSPRDADRPAALVRMALESWHDGCLGEGAAAARAKRALAGAADSEAQAALAVIATDEARHAELGWRVLAYCLSEGGRSVRGALGAAIVCPEPAPPEGEPARDAEPAAMQAYGRLDRGQADAAWAETWSAARRDGERVLAAA
jgi:hypothetical protein